MQNNPFLTVTLAAVLFAGGVVVGNLTAGTDFDAVSAMGEARESVSNSVSDYRDSDTGATSDASAPRDNSGVAFTINIENLPEAQKAFIRSMGVDGNEIVVTNDMYACAEAKLGAERMGEIKNGAVPGMSEGLQLLACYN